MLCLPADILEVVRRRDDLGGPGAQAVAGGLGDDSAAAHKVVVLVEDETSPGELPGGGLSVREARHGACEHYVSDNLRGSSVLT